MSHDLNQSMLDIHPIELSSIGQARRAAMLGDLVNAMQTVHRRRRARRRAVAAASGACLLAAAALLAAPLLNSRSAPPAGELLVARPEAPLRGPAVSPGDAASIRPRIVRIATDPTILDRYRPDPPRIVRRVGDEELLRALAAIDRPAGLIRVGDVVRLTLPVTDDELH